MISYLTGKAKVVSADNITVLTPIGVGFSLFIPTNENIKNGDEVTFYVKTIVREDDISLYGFESEEHKNIFEQLISVSGIGPRTAIGIMGKIEPIALAQMIISGNSTDMAKVKGLGKKTAEKLVFSLKEKLSKEYNNKPAAKVTNQTEVDDTIQSLIFLGFSKNEAVNAVNKFFDKEKSVEENLKIILLKIKG